MEGERRSGRDDDPALSWWEIIGLYFLALVYVSVVGLGLGTVLGMHVGVLVSQVVGVLGAAVIYRSVRGDRCAPWPDLDRIGLGPGRCVVMAATIVFLGMAANAFMALQVEVIPQLQPFAERYEEFVNRLVLQAEGIDRVLGLLGICVAAPLCEEVLFRGALLSEKLRTGTVTTAVVVNGVLFAAFHQNPISLVPLSFVGMFLAHLIVMTDAIWSAIFAHAILNAFNGVVVPEILPGADTSELSTVVVAPFGTEIALPPTAQLGIVLVVCGAVGGGLWAKLASSRASDRETAPE